MSYQRSASANPAAQEAGDDRPHPATPTAARRAGPPPATTAVALRAPGGARGDRHRRQPALGARGGPPGAARRGSRRPRPRDHLDAPQAVRAASRQDIDAWDADASAIPLATQNALRTLEWIDRAEVLVVCGPSGTGKSHFIEALGHQAIDRGKTVAWHTLESLAVLIRRHRPDDSINKAIAKLIRADIVLMDDVALLPVSTDAAEAMFRVIDAAYEKRSIAISSNIHPSGFDELMPKTIVTATVDRLMHHAHVLITDIAESYRLA